jgi:hypothetical protein
MASAATPADRDPSPQTQRLALPAFFIAGFGLGTDAFGHGIRQSGRCAGEAQQARKTELTDASTSICARRCNTASAIPGPPNQRT